jgi:predicted MPP superfamily phosphohydrolase
MALCGVYAVWVEPYWIDVSIHDMRSDEAKDAIRIVQLSDLHLQEFSRREREVANQVNALKPDLVVLSGDVIDRRDRLPILHSFLAALGETTIVAVLGNWEYWAKIDLHALRNEYQHHGIRLLVNETASYQVRHRTLSIAGMDDFTAGKPDSELLNAPFDGTAVIVQHSPGYFENLPTKTGRGIFSLCLAGHTHGGQFTLFGWPIWRPSGSGSFVSGLYETSVCNLYVSRGVGTSVLPIRFGARPEIAVFDL